MYTSYDSFDLFNSKKEFEKVNYVRVLRHPKIESGKITLKVCSKDGIYEKVIFKKDKELFKIARKLKCGDIINIDNFF